MEVQLPKLHKSQLQIKNSPARFRVVCAGRRWGKSRLASVLATATALAGGFVWIVVPVYASGQPLFDDVKRLAMQLPGTTINRTERRVDYPSGGYVQVRSGDQPALLRGFSLDLAIFDEAAYTAHLEELWNEIIRPALADRKGRALFQSSPAGKNYFWQLYQLGLDPLQRDWQCWKMPTSSSPFIDEAEIESARRQLTERQFAQEFLAEFVDSGSVFRNVRELATAKPQAAPQAGHRYTAGIDWGRSGDSTVIVVYDATTKAVAYMDRFTGMAYDIQLGRVATCLELWRPFTTVVETNNFGQAMFEDLQKRRLHTHLVGFTTGNANKSLLVDCLALALERSEITLLNDELMIGEMQAFEAKPLDSGLIRYGAPSGGHDDIVIALLLAYGPNATNGPTELRPAFVAPLVQGKAQGWTHKGGWQTRKYQRFDSHQEGLASFLKP